MRARVAPLDVHPAEQHRFMERVGAGALSTRRERLVVVDERQSEQLGPTPGLTRWAAPLDNCWGDFTN